MARSGSRGGGGGGSGRGGDGDGSGGGASQADGTVMHFLLYLNKDTFVGAQGQQLIRELRVARRKVACSTRRVAASSLRVLR